VRKKFGNNAMAVLGGMGVDWFGANDMNQVAANSNDIPKLGQQFRERSERLDNMLPAETQRQYQGTHSNLTNNADQIGNSFLAAIARLSPAINGLSDTLTKDITGFLNGPNGQAVFKAVSDGLQQLGTWLAGPKFQQDLDTFTTAVLHVISAIGAAVKWIASVTPSGTGAGKDEADPALVNFGDKYLGGELPGADPVTNKYTAISPMDRVYEKYQMPDEMKTDVQKFVSQANDIYKLPKGFMSAVAGAESSWNPLAKGKPDKNGQYAKGMWQFWDSTAKAYDLEGNDVYDPYKSTRAAGRYLRDNMNRYHGDIAKTLTQYNGGRIDKQGNLNLNKETIDYLIKLLPQVQGGVDQHPGIMWQLSEARGNLANAGKDARSTIKLEVVQKPGSDINVQAIGQFLPH
jgi:hypothetical protein